MRKEKREEIREQALSDLQSLSPDEKRKSGAIFSIYLRHRVENVSAEDRKAFFFRSVHLKKGAKC